MGEDTPDAGWATPMPHAHYINDPNHWRDRAQEMRNMASDAPDQSAKESMLKIAQEYDRLAGRAAQRAGK